MKGFQKRLLKIYDDIINELEQIDFEHKEYLKEVSKRGDTPAETVSERMAIARDNHRRLQNARAEKELIKSYNFN